MGILSIGEVNAQSMFDILRQMSDYGALANEVKSIEVLVEKWHTSLPEASIIGRQSPLPIWGDFLDRMAFSVEAGQPHQRVHASRAKDVFQRNLIHFMTRD